MIDWQLIETADLDALARSGERVLIRLPGLGVDVATVSGEKDQNTTIYTWVDQWNNDPYDVAGEGRIEPTHWAKINLPTTKP